MKRALLLLAFLPLAGSSSAGTPEYGPDDAIGRLIAHADSLKPEWHITRPQEALSCLLEHGTARSLVLLEATIADPATPAGYKQWLIERIPWYGRRDTGAVPCARARLLTNLLAPDRLEALAWPACFASLASVLSAYPTCIEQQHLDLIKEQFADEDFLGLRSALMILGAAAGGGSSATLRRDAFDLFWQGYDRLVAMEGELAPDPLALAGMLSSGLHRLLDNYPTVVDQQCLERVAAALERCGKADVDCERAADLLASALRARPDFSAAPNWAALRGALYNGHSPRDLPEGTLLAIANLIPYAPQWIDEPTVEALLEALVEKDSALRKRASRCYFGGTPECLLACAIYGAQPRLRERILAALWRIAEDEKAAPSAQREALSALAAIAWNRPELIDVEFKRAALARAERARAEGFAYDADNSARVLLQLSVETHPELTTRRDLAVVRGSYASPRAAFNPGLEGLVLALAASCTDELYAELEAILVEQVVAVIGVVDAGSDNAAYSQQRLLTRARCVRAGLGPCD